MLNVIADQLLNFYGLTFDVNEILQNQNLNFVFEYYSKIDCFLEFDDFSKLFL